MTEPRDTQRSRLYKAENAAFKGNPLGGKRLETVPDIERFVQKVANRAPIKSRYPELARSPIRVKDGRGRRRACGGYRSISIPLWARTEWIVLHELAHVATLRRHGETVAAHGREFVSCYLTLIYFILGKEASAHMRKHLDAGRVKWRLIG
jgi:putative metallohydrolase (TIGR04338 family)